ncbi:U4/U6.U5 snRNP associated protein [Coemansia sp. RSA 2336]|nr:U4/U6.U5 snRNP associated protein [Coemansia sp. RSA 2336]
MSNLNAYGGEKQGDSFRKKWDIEAYAQKARDREEKLRADEQSEERRHKGQKSQTLPMLENPELLEARKSVINLDKMVGKTQVIQATSAAAGQPGFYCKECDITVKDSLSFLDHINGRKHQHAINRIMKVRSETLEDVVKKLEELRRIKRRQQRIKEGNSDYSFYERVEMLRNAEQEKKRRQKEAKRKHRMAKQTADEETDEMAAMMGFSSFGSKK